MSQARFLLAHVFVFSLGLAGASPVHAANPRDELLRRTPPEVSFCLVVRDLRTHFAAIAAGPLAKAFPTSKLGAHLLATPEIQQLDQVGQQLSRDLGVDWSQLRDDLFGDCVVLAYQNGPHGKSADERGVALTWARDPKLVQQLLERIDAAQKQGGELKEVRELAHRGKTYYQRVKAKGPDDFYFVHDAVVAFSQQESMIRRVLELEDTQAAEAASLAQRFDRLDVGGAVASLWINPRSFDSDLEQKIKQAKGGEAAFLQTFRTCWGALDDVVISLRLERHAELRLQCKVREKELPGGLRRLAKTVAEPSTLWAVFPTETLLATAWHIDPAAWTNALSEFLDADMRKALAASAEQNLGPVFGKSALPLLPNYLGPDFGIAISPPVAARESVPEFLAAVRIRGGKDSKRVEQSVLDALDVGTTLLRLAYNAKNSEPIRVRSENHSGVEVKYLVHESFPAGFQPAYAIKEGFLLVASSPAVIRRISPSTARSQNGSTTPLVSVSLRQWDRYLAEHGDAVVALMTAKNEVSKDEARMQIQKMRAAIELFDRLELLAASGDAGHASLILRVHFANPLRK